MLIALALAVLIGFSEYFYIDSSYSSRSSDRCVSALVIVLSALSLPAMAMGYVRSKNEG